MTQEIQKTWALYKITNLENNKVYIGQTVEPSKRWYQHRRDSATPKYPIHHAINKYGVQGFEFEIIALCKTQDNANYLEELLIKQYDSLVQNSKGYNVSLGGSVAPKSEQWIQSMKDWHASLSPEEKEARSKMHSESIIQRIAAGNHPAQGRIVTEEEKELHRKARLENPIEYTPELRQKMSVSHLGIIDSEETKQKKSSSAAKAWAQRVDYSNIKCSAPGCQVQGKAKYKFINDVRYCNKHGLRMLRYNRLNILSD